MLYEEAILQVSTVAKKYQKQAGILVRNAEDLPGLKEYGFTCLAIGSDLGFIREGFTRILSAIQSKLD